MAADALFLLRRPGNFEQERFVEWTGEKFHGNRRLIGLGTLQATAVGVIGVGHAVVDFACRTSGHHNGGEAADGAKIHAPAATCAAPKVEIRFQRRFLGQKFGSDNFVPAFSVLGSVRELNWAAIRFGKTMCGGTVL